MKTGDKDYIKNLNLGIVLDTIREEGPISRAAIARTTGLSRSTCSLLAEELLKSDLILETGKDSSSGGRKPVLLELNYHCGRAIGVKVMEDSLHVALVDMRGSIIETVTSPMGSDRSPEDYIAELNRMIARFIEKEKNSSDPKRILGIGIGVAGRVDHEKGVLLESSILGWKNVDIAGPLNERFDIPVYLENDVNTFTIGERFFGQARGEKDFLCLTVGRGIGIGIIMDGKLHRGAHDGAGEFGHMKVASSSFNGDGSDRPALPVCSCGRPGCVEAFAADPALLDWVERTGGERLTLEELREKTRTGDERCIEAYRRAGHYLGIAVANVINFLDPRMIILGGEGGSMAPYFLPSMEAAIRANSVYGLSGGFTILPAEPEKELWVRGVATLVIRNVFSIPL